MSWGYWFDLEATLSRAAWEVARKRSPKDHAPEAGWSRFRTQSLATALDHPRMLENAEPFSKVLSWPVFRREGIHRLDTKAEPVSIRVAVLLDKSNLETGTVLGAFLEAVRFTGGEARLRVVNDGTAPGRDNWLHRVRDGAWTHERIEDWRAVADRLVAELYGDGLDRAGDEPTGVPVTRTTEHEILHESGTRFAKGDHVGARALLEGWLGAGHAMTSSVLQSYAGIARHAMPGGAASRALLVRVRDAMTTQPSFARSEGLVLNVLLLLGENGAAAEAVDVALDAVAHDHQRWTGSLALNATWAASIARDPGRSARLLEALRAAGYDPTRRSSGAFDDEPRIYANAAELHAAAGEIDLALACVARAVRRVFPPDPELVEALRIEPTLAPLRGDRRWPDVLRGVFPAAPKTTAQKTAAPKKSGGREPTTAKPASKGRRR